MDKKTEKFIELFSLAEKKYGSSSKRLASDSWPYPWQTLVATILSAQTRDEVTIPVAEELFRRYPTVDELARADYSSVLSVIKRINYNSTKAKNIIAAAKHLIMKNNGQVPDTVGKLIEIPGVGLKTANLVLSEVFGKDAICVDTHVHRIMNIFGIVRTKTPEETEEELRKIAPVKCWRRINRYFVLLGKEVPGKDKKKFLEKLSS